MMKQRLILIAWIALAVGLSGCVSKKKYTEMETLKGKVQDMLDAKQAEVKRLSEENSALKKDLSDCNETTDRLRQDSIRLASLRQTTLATMDELKASCDQLQNNYDQLKSQSTRKMRDMVDQLEELQRDLAAREARLAEVEGKLRQRDSIMSALQKRVSNALLGFKDEGLTVEIRNGKVYVSLSNKLLFASGSTKIDANGEKALAELAGILKDQADITIMVEGHTDNVPVVNLGQIKDNWDLSVMRSTEVVRLLVENGLQPERIIPAGRGEFMPKVMEDTKEARASNRRTEIVISPKLDELYELINKGAGE